MLDIAIVDGIRTPFAKAFGPLKSIRADDLGRHAVQALLKETDLPTDKVDQVVIGNVIMPAEATNIARVIALKAGIPEDRIAHSVQRNCASGMESITTAAQLIQLGEAERIVAGGAESMSQVPLLYNAAATAQYGRLAKAKTFWQRMKTIMGFRPRHFQPIPGLKLGLSDGYCGMIMGETAELVADDFNITRDEQDSFAVESHKRAATAQEKCVLKEEITPYPMNGKTLDQDVGPRGDQSLEALAKLRPYFRQNGTVTVGNACPITDGAAAVLVMPGELARSEGRKPLGYLRAFAYAGCDPRRMGLGPAFATAKLIKKTGISLKDIDLIEMNEAFAAQIIGNERAFASDEFARNHLGLDKAIGEIDRTKLNVNGGAIALGHPVGATGTRLIITLLKELHRRNLKRGLATLCVGGGQGAALLLETE